jgi:hypothetical protein
MASIVGQLPRHAIEKFSGILAYANPEKQKTSW